MNIPKNKIIIISLVTLVIAVSSFTSVYAQTIQDLRCPACIQISDTKTLDIHKNLPLGIILWADGFDYTYDHKSIITINGHSKLNDPDTPILFRVIDPIGNLVTVQQIMVAPNSDFDVKFNPDGPLWKKDGMYIITAQGGPQSTVFKTKVELTGGSSTTVKCNENELNAKGHCIPFSITGATIPNAFIDTKSKSIVISLSGSTGGTLNIKPSTDIIKEISMVLIDGQEWDDVIINGNDVTISFYHGAKKIEVIGSYVIPEFGSIAVLILVIAIITGVVFSRKKLMTPVRSSF